MNSKKKGTQKEFIPHPATWLDINDQRWNDDLSEVPETAIIQTNAKAKEEDEEDKKNQEEKEALDKKIALYQKDPVKWKQIEQQALSELSESQRQSTMMKHLLNQDLITQLITFGGEHTRITSKI